VSWAEVHGGDLSIFPLADDPEYGGIWEVSRRHAGLVVLHDVALPRLFTGHFRRQPDGAAAYRAEMERCYGDTGRWLAPRLWDGRVPIDFLADRCPHTALAVEGRWACWSTPAPHTTRCGRRRAGRSPASRGRATRGCTPTGCCGLCEEARRYRPRSMSYYLAGRAAAAMSPWAGRHGERRANGSPDPSSV